jgi:UDP-N-acetylglucosamine 2-epimerase (non-hydrolysing)
MKVAPVIEALETRGAETILVHTGQHYDDDMSGVFFEELGIRAPDYQLDAGSGTHAVQTAKVMTRFEPVLGALRPDVVVVVGDVNSTLACAIVAAKAGALVAHVEAGLRSRDWAMPEEINRVVVDRVSDYLFAPSADAVENLRAEGYHEVQIHLVGSVMIDTLLRNLERAKQGSTLSDLGLKPRSYGLVTLHRPSNVDSDDVLCGLLKALDEIATTLPLIYPAHPRARERIERLGVPDGVTLIEPAGYLDFIALQAGARLVLTDSGGVQEETTVLGVPCLTLRETTERPVTVSEGSNQVVGVNPLDIVAAAEAALTADIIARRPALWDGHAAERIADVLLDGDRA